MIAVYGSCLKTQVTDSGFNACYLAGSTASIRRYCHTSRQALLSTHHESGGSRVHVLRRRLRLSLATIQCCYSSDNVGFVPLHTCVQDDAWTSGGFWDQQEWSAYIPRITELLWKGSTCISFRCGASSSVTQYSTTFFLKDLFSRRRVEIVFFQRQAAVLPGLCRP